MSTCVSPLELRPYRTVQAVGTPHWEDLDARGAAWLWLDGAQRPGLEEEVAGLCRPAERTWVWRGTAWEYGRPGYRQGPLLLRLSETLLDRYLSDWSEAGAGVILVSDDVPALVTHLQNLRHITAANGDSVCFSLRAFRTLEEFSEGLSEQALSRLLGPIQSILWRLPGESDPWRSVHNPAPDCEALEHDSAFALTEPEEAALDHAAIEAFQRRSMQRLRNEYPELLQSESVETLIESFTTLLRESRELQLAHERDVFHFMRLRMTYPRKTFVEHRELRQILCNKPVSARLRLRQAELILKQHHGEEA
ncbi:MAG: DUF4123 domain-containing protein [Pseudomonas sp.]